MALNVQLTDRSCLLCWNNISYFRSFYLNLCRTCKILSSVVVVVIYLIIFASEFASNAKVRADGFSLSPFVNLCCFVFGIHLGIFLISNSIEVNRHRKRWKEFHISHVICWSKAIVNLHAKSERNEKKQLYWWSINTHACSI